MLWIILAPILLYIIIELFTFATNARCTSKVCLIGKTALIIGGNTGLGYELAKALATRGCTVIIADYEKATESARQIIEETHNPNIIAKHVDLRSFKSVRKFAKDIVTSFDAIHILMNNAGIGDITYEMTEDGVQTIMQINYFSHFLLTHLLAGLLIKSAPSRIIFTSSIAAYNANLTIENLKGERPEASGIMESAAYGNSKLALAIFSRSLAKKLENTGVTSNCLHPGFVKTKIWQGIREVGPKIRFYSWFAYNVLFGKNAEEGVQTMLHLCCSDDVKNVSGKFFFECVPSWQPKKVHDEKLRADIWKLSEEVVQLKPDEKLDCVLKSIKF
ncbi:retinol dehydrogenase 12-like [Cylas formicarius]|uniref:retinol dehydrogenase 12-like n=1 Tax=Cylas formicarius TaxID=197179 RepID=UPI00295874B7|nr:retinol dehydrogenase 12-like [Cylas formicarius]